MKKFISIVVSFIILIFLFFLILLPKKEFSYNENRYLEKFPKFSLNELFNGKYTSSLSDYVSDHFPFREYFLSIKSNVFKYLGTRYQSDIYYGEDGYLLQEYKKPTKNKKIVNKINNFSTNINSNIHVMLVPTSIYINNDKLSKYNKNYNEELTIKYFKDNLSVNFIDTISKLKQNKNKYLYYKTDHHWTTYGAYYAYLEFCDSMNLTPISYKFEMVDDKFYGTLYSKILDNSLDYDKIFKVVDNNNYVVNYDNNIEKNSLYNDAYLSKKDKYSYFLDNNHALITIKNINSNNYNSILVIKDSYANSFIPLISSHYKYIYVIDPRYYHDSIINYINENNVKDVLFLYNVLTIDDDLGILSIK